MADPELTVDSIHRTKSICDDEVSSCTTDDGSTVGKIQSSFLDLITDLTKMHPNPDYGHFESYAYALYCKSCQMVLQPKYASRVPCKMADFVVCQDGTVNCVHTKCEKLNLTEYISSTEKECGSSAKTYWRLWSECHFLLCTTCKWQYPVRNSAMCQYHPENPEYFHIGNLGLEQPIGRYPCCGERAFRFEVIKNPFGCKFRMHVPNVVRSCDIRVKEIMLKHPKLTTIEPPQLNYEKKIMKLVDSDPGIKRHENRHWWVNLMLGEMCSIQSIILPICNLIGTEKKQKKQKDLNKRKKLSILELNKRMALNHKRSKPLIRSSKNSNEGFIDTEPPKDEFEKVKDTLNKEDLWRTLSPMITIQDLQREQESIIFNHIAVRLTKFPKVINNPSSGAINQHRDIYTTIHANMMVKIDACNKTAGTKINKTLTDKKKKY